MQRELQTNRNCVLNPIVLRCVIVFALLSGGLLPMNDLAYGQPAAAKAKPVEYAELKFNDDLLVPENFKKLKSSKDEMLKGTAAYNKQELERFYLGFLLPALTAYNAPEKLNFARVEILYDLDRAEKASEAVLSDFNTFLSAEMKKLAEGSYHPSTSIVATQILGRLNKKPTKGNVSAEPLSSATGVLLGLLRSKTNDGIRAAAISGLERHIDLMHVDWEQKAPAAINALADTFFASLTSPKPVERSLRADAWLRGRSIELMLKFKHSKEAALYHYAMTALADPKTHPLLFEKALLAVGTYAPVEPNASQTAPAISNSMSYLISMAKEWKKRLNDTPASASVSSPSGEGAMMTPAAGNDGGAGGGPEGAGGEDPMAKGKRTKEKTKVVKTNSFDKQSEDVKAKRRALHELLEIVRYGFSNSKFGPMPIEFKTGLATLVAQGEERQLMTDVLNAIKDLQDTLNSPSIADRAALGSEAIPKVDVLIESAEFLQNLLTPPADGVPTPTAQPEVTTDPAN